MNISYQTVIYFKKSTLIFLVHMTWLKKVVTVEILKPFWFYKAANILFERK